MPEYRICEQSLNYVDKNTNAINFKHRTSDKYNNLDTARYQAKKIARNIRDERYETIYIVEADKGTIETWIRRGNNVMMLNV